MAFFGCIEMLAERTVLSHSHAKGGRFVPRVAVAGWLTLQRIWLTGYSRKSLSGNGCSRFRLHCAIVLRMIADS